MNDYTLVKKLERFERNILIPKALSRWHYKNDEDHKGYKTIDFNYLWTVGCGCCGGEVYVNPKKRTTEEVLEWILASHIYMLNNLKKYRFKFEQ